MSNNTSLTVSTILQTLNSNFSPSTRHFYGGNSTNDSAANNVVNGINTTGDITNALSLTAPAGAVAYTPAQVRAAYGISSLSLDGTGQTIAIVDAYDDPNIFQAAGRVRHPVRPDRLRADARTTSTGRRPRS